MEILHCLPGERPARNLVLDRITQLYPILSRAERRVADFVLSDPHALARTPISGITCGSGASAPTVMRFCRSVGFGGLTDLKLGLVAALGKKPAATDPAIPAHAEAIAQAQVLIRAARAVTCIASHDLLAASVYARDALLGQGIRALLPDAQEYVGVPDAAMPVNAVGLFFCSGPLTATLIDTMTRYHRHGGGAIVAGDVRMPPDVEVTVHILASATPAFPVCRGSARLLPHLLVTDLLIDELMCQRRVADPAAEELPENAIC